MDFPTIAVLAVVFLTVGGIIAKMIINRKKGKTSCSCGCGGCAMREMCHSKEKNK